ncbi:universal stress protein [Salinirubrum litoreum]|uniref:Universal stress protein n=1 Tax=Salinirubrum litoreum TaxID=1126234 RepID=A0ABD5RFC8_9EURY|nr:universal stress protein [Salinirubrum litoreum]
MTARPSVLVPVRVLQGESIPEGVPQLLANANVVLLGYHVVPEQTAPGQARLQFEERARARLDELEAIFTEAGATVERRLVFTRDGQTTIDRLVYEHDCLAVLVPNATGPPEDVLVALRGTVGADRTARLVAGLFADTETDVTLYHVAGGDESDDDVTLLLDSVGDRLVELGMAASAITTEVGREQTALDAIVEAAESYDAVVMGETDPSLTTLLFGMPTEQVAERFLGPVLVVQRERPPEADGDDDAQDDLA